MNLFNVKNPKTEFTRMCIAEAIIELMDNKPLDSIRISSVVIKAGVSRMTFYNNYASISEALEDYLQILIRLYLEESNTNPQIGRYLEYEHILFSLKFFDRYSRYFQIMSKRGLHNVMLNATNSFLAEHITHHSPYELYCYGGGLLNTFLKWEEDKAAKSAEEIAAIMAKLYKH